jgi:hypothetical protein
LNNQAVRPVLQIVILLALSPVQLALLLVQAARHKRAIAHNSSFVHLMLL